MEKELFSLLLPAGLTALFELDKVEKQSDSYHLYLSQKNIHPQKYKGHKLESKGYFDEITLRDFPLRGGVVF